MAPPSITLFLPFATLRLLAADGRLRLWNVAPVIFYHAVWRAANANLRSGCVAVLSVTASVLLRCTSTSDGILAFSCGAGLRDPSPFAAPQTGLTPPEHTISTDDFSS